jgi:SAM-dependent methyltransferase
MNGQRSQYDPTLFEGTAWHYLRYRPPYPGALFDYLATCYQLDGTARALDLGCGPGQLALALSPYFEQVIAMDPDEEMLKEARRATNAAGLLNLQFLLGSSWDLSLAMGEFRLVTMGESFHWMDREGVLRILYEMVSPAGGVVIISQKIHTSSEYKTVVDGVLKQFLGERRRAGCGSYSHPPERHETVLARSPFTMRDPWEDNSQWDRTIDQILGFLYSTSYASQRLLGDQVGRFEDELRQQLRTLEPAGSFTFPITVTALLASKPG